MSARGKVTESAMTYKLPKLLTEREAAAYLGINPRSLAGLRLAGKIECVRVSERRYRYLEEQLLKYLNIKDIEARVRSYIAPREPKPVQRRKNLPLVVAEPMFPKPRRRKVIPG